MTRRFGLLMLALTAAAAIPAGSALAQYYPAPPGYYRGAPPPDSYQGESLPAPGYIVGNEDDDVPVMPRRGGRQYSQVPQGDPQSQMQGQGQVQQGNLPPPGFATPDGRPPAYGHQLDTPAVAVAPSRGEADVMRPPGAVGPAPGTGPGVAPQGGPPAVATLPPEDQPEVGQPKELAENLRKQLVDYSTKEPAGTIIVDTAHTYLYLVLGNGKALRYGVRVGRDGFTWTGTERISRMKEWPDWFPPAEMIERQPYLPRFMAGGNGNPLGARAMYLGKTLYRIHGTNQPSTIGHYVSSGCVGMLNEDVEDLFSRVQVGTRVVVLPGKPPSDAMASDSPPEPANPMAPPSRAGTAVSGQPQPPVR
jgi:lipoprotein-anchoring transpeptidase ErfK/SrfK